MTNIDEIRINSLTEVYVQGERVDSSKFFEYSKLSEDVFYERLHRALRVLGYEGLSNYSKENRMEVALQNGDLTRLFVAVENEGIKKIVYGCFPKSVV